MRRTPRKCGSKPEKLIRASREADREGLGDCGSSPSSAKSECRWHLHDHSIGRRPGVFLVKGWAFTVAGLFLGFAVSQHQWTLALVSLIPTSLFFFFDGYLLRTERRFRTLFDHVRKGDKRIPPFFMAATERGAELEEALESDERAKTSYPAAFERPAILYFYPPLVLATLAVAAVVAFSGRTSVDAWKIWALFGLGFAFIGAAMNAFASAQMFSSSRTRLTLTDEARRRQWRSSAVGWASLFAGTICGFIATLVQ